ncbi:MAG TPA: zincin-like metallopeptidase domain-containing protein, partial [Anaerolineales bacterium]|nr:zincin-like metallopeptidase domain-containing protein [Anaerolineales bacterium]
MDLYAEVTDTIIAELEKGAAPWVKRWRASTYAHNAITKRPYTGINTLLLWIEAGKRGYENPGWLTYKQAKEAGGHVRKGEKSTLVVFVKPIEKEEEDPETGEMVKKAKLILRDYRVFNVSQCDNLPEKYTKLEERREVPDPEFDSWIKRTGANVSHGGDRACYIPSLDAIRMPHRRDFESKEHYSATMLHELGHWTGHESRLNRNLTGRFGEMAYAAEELIAELTAAFLCADMGINGDFRVAGYIESWLKLLGNDKRAVFTAASGAQKAADLLKELASKEQKAVA